METSGDKLDLRAGDDVRIYVNGKTTHKLGASFENNGDISFYESTGTTPKFFWDSSAESLGIGTSSPTYKLNVLADAGAQSIFQAGQSGISNGLSITSNGSALTYSFLTGNVGIGTSSPSTPLHIQGSDTASSEQLLSLVNGGGATGAGARLWLSGTNATTRGTYIEGQARSTGNNHDLIFATSATSAAPTERMRIDFNGNVGIGTSSPTYKVGLGDSSGTERFAIDVGSIQAESIHLAANNRHLVLDASGPGGRYVSFKTGTTAYSGTERMRIDSSGNLLVGKTSTTLATAGAEIRADGFIRATVSNATCMQVNRTTGTGTAIDLRYAGTSVGSIVVGASSTTYNTSSDQRLKENIVDAPSASDDIDAIQVRSFDWKADGSHQKYGMVAQELQSVAPEAVSGDADSDDMMGVDYSKLVPMMLKEIQSLRARVAELENN
jgi:hypothetical protein